MPEALQSSIDARIAAATAALDLDAIERTYRDQDEFVFIEKALPASLTNELVREYERLPRSAVHRSWVPASRQAGTVGYGAIVRHAPLMNAVYRSPAMLGLSRRLAGKDLVLKSSKDEHACALYAYDRPGDSIGYHYVTCGCELGASYAVIIGLVNRSRVRFVAELYKRTGSQPVRYVEHETPPGSMLLFCGDNVWHATSPIRRGEERVVMCLSYVKRGKHIKGIRRLTENLRDAVFYFGLPALLQRHELESEHEDEHQHEEPQRGAR